MKNSHFKYISLMLILALIVFNGCKDDESVTNNTALEKGKQVESTQNANVTAELKPAVDENTITEGYAFPTLEFTSFTGKQINIAELKGKVVLIDFWAAWCGPCVQAMPDLIETYKQYHDKGFEIIGISLDRTQKQFEDFIKENNMTWPQYYDGLAWENKIAQRFGVKGIPHIVIIDKTGAVYFNTDYDKGKQPYHGVELRNEIAKLL